MLYLKRITRFNEFMRCNASGEILMYGDFYYEDDATGEIISATYYHNQKMQKKREEWEYQDILENAQNQKEYQDELRRAEEEYLTEIMLDKQVFGKDSDNLAKDRST